MDPRVYRRVLGAVLLVVVVCVLSGTVISAAAEPSSYSMLGTWTTGYLEGNNRLAANGSYDITQMNMATGAFSGTAETLSVKFTVEGTESGSVAKMTLKENSYTAYDTLHLSVLGNGHVGGNGTFSETGYSETGSGFWAEEGQAQAQRASATSVICNLQAASGQYRCVATVGDASGQAPAQTPTGTVTFSASSGGFIGSEKCLLEPTPSSGGVAECAVIYNPPAGGIPAGTAVPVTADYPGDSTFAASSGQDTLQNQPPNTGTPTNTGETTAPPIECFNGEGWTSTTATTASVAHVAQGGVQPVFIKVPGPGNCPVPKPNGPIDAAKAAAKAYDVGYGEIMSEGAARWSFAAAASTAIAVPVPGGAAVAGPWVAGEGLAAAIMLNSANNASVRAKDPPDPNFKVIARAKIPHIPVTAALRKLPTKERQQFLLVEQLEAQASALSSEATTSIDRAASAHAARQSAWERKQMLADARFSSQLAVTLNKLASGMTALAHSPLLAKFGSTELTAQEVATVANSVAAHGLPKSLSSTLTLFGVSPAWQKLLSKMMAGAGATPGTSIGLGAITAESFTSAAKELKSYAGNLRAYAARVHKKPVSSNAS